MRFPILPALAILLLLSPAMAQTQQPETKQPDAKPATQEITVSPAAIPGVAPEYQDAARKAIKARQKVATCQKQATEQKVLPRDRTQYVLACIDKLQD